MVTFFVYDGLSSLVQQAALSLTSPLPGNSGAQPTALNLARGLTIVFVVVSFTAVWLGYELLRAKNVIRRLQDGQDVELPKEFESVSVNDSEKNQQELERAYQQLQQQRTMLKKIQSQMYEDNVRPRHDFVSFRALYIVGPDGDIEVEKEVILTSQELEVHFWRFFANGEQFAKPLDAESDMELQVRALDDGRTDCIPLLVDDKPTRKEFTVNFLPAITPGTQRAFVVKYYWPGFLRELVDTGSTNYFWESKAFTNGGIADFAVEWRFDPIYGNVQCETTRANPLGMRLDKTRRHPGTKWVYAGRQIPLGNLPLELSFWREDASPPVSASTF